MFARDSSGRFIFFCHQGGVDQICYIVSLLQGAQRKRASSGKTIIATCPSPAPEDALRVYGPCFVFQHANPRASGYVCPSGTGRRSDTARRASGDATASGLISWMLFPSIY